MRITAGMRSTSRVALRLRHWVVRSARSRDEKTVDVFGRFTVDVVAGVRVAGAVMVVDMVSF
jgi:hypothetical protein